MCFSPALTPTSPPLAVPARYWTEKDVLAAFDRVFGGSSFRTLTRIAARCLGYGLAGDAEDECQEFALRRFRKVVRRFDPARGDFEQFVHFCFKRWCRARARILRRTASRTQPLDSAALARATSKEEAPERRILSSEVGREVRRALAKLKDRDRTLVVMQFWNDTTVAARAAALGCSPGTARTRTCRVLRQLVPELRDARTALGIGGAR